MEISSPLFGHSQIIPKKYTCDGQDINPPIMIKNVPEGTVSLALIMDDPDAIKPAGKVWDHWLVWNISPEVKYIAEGAEPAGVHGLGTSGNLKYHGPCPPDGQHHYIFKIYALDRNIDLPEGSSKTELLKSMDGHVLESAQLIGVYSRG